MPVETRESRTISLDASACQSITGSLVSFPPLILLRSPAVMVGQWKQVSRGLGEQTRPSSFDGTARANPEQRSGAWCISARDGLRSKAAQRLTPQPSASKGRGRAALRTLGMKGSAEGGDELAALVDDERTTEPALQKRGDAGIERDSTGEHDIPLVEPDRTGE